MWCLPYLIVSTFIFKCDGASFGEYCDSACGLVALVPARGGSKGIINKNIAMLGNKTLISRTISTIITAKAFESVWVSTDVESIATEAEAAGAQVHWRAAETATDNASTMSAVHDFLMSHPEARTVAVVQCTSPFLCPSWLNEAATLMEDSETECAFSVTRSFKLRWSPQPDGTVQPENFDPFKRPRRQDWAGELYETGMFYFTKRRLLEAGTLQNDKCKVVEVASERSLEIDSALDLELARSLQPVLQPCPTTDNT